MRTEAAMPADHAPPVAPSGRPPSRKGLMIAGVATAVLAAGVVATGVASRHRQESAVQGWTAAQAIPAVSVVRPDISHAARALTLPGQLQAYYNAQIYSRVSGYVRMWYDDIGARVKQGQLLAVIDTPETDAQIVQARADLATAEANRNLAATTAQRWSRLLKQDAVSTQESEEKAGDLAAKTAQVQAYRANLDRLLALKSFSRITAPFDGVVTARRTDIGALVNAGAGATPNSELFDVAKIDRLRLYVRVPQVNSAEIRSGVAAALTVPELPGKSFPAQLETTSSAISDNSGTMTTELMVDNPAGTLKPGAYAQVKFDLPPGGGTGVMLLPSSTIMFRNKGVEVAVIGPDDHVHIRHVSVGRDLGATMEITSGVSPSDQVVNNPPDSIADGELVRVVQPDAGKGG